MVVASNFNARSEWESIPRGDFLYLSPPDFAVRLVNERNTFRSAKTGVEVSYLEARFKQKFTGIPIVGINNKVNEFYFSSKDTKYSVLKEHPLTISKIKIFQYELLKEAFTNANKNYTIPEMTKMLVFFRNKKQSPGATDVSTSGVQNFLTFMDTEKNKFSSMVELKKGCRDSYNVSTSPSNYVIGAIFSLGFTQSEYRSKLRNFLLHDINSEEIASSKNTRTLGTSAYAASVLSLTPKGEFLDLPEADIEKVMSSSCQQST